MFSSSLLLCATLLRLPHHPPHLTRPVVWLFELQQASSNHFEAPRHMFCHILFMQESSMCWFGEGISDFRRFGVSLCRPFSVRTLEMNFLHQKAHLLYCQPCFVTWRWAEEEVAVYRETVTSRSGVPVFPSVVIGLSLIPLLFILCFLDLDVNKKAVWQSWKNQKRTWNHWKILQLNKGFSSWFSFRGFILTVCSLRFWSILVCHACMAALCSVGPVSGAGAMMKSRHWGAFPFDHFICRIPTPSD